MPGHLVESAPLAGAQELTRRIQEADFSGCSATVVGYGNMGREYVKALKALGVLDIRVCSRSPEPLKELEARSFSGGYEQFRESARPGEVGILSTPTADLIPAARRLVSLGFQRLLIEKPVSLFSESIRQFAQEMEAAGVEVWAAYNRVAYPCFLEARFRTQQEGGIRSCAYTFTELIHKIDPAQFAPEELKRWGIANSLHVMSMAHGLIGMPENWSGFRSGSLDWHPAGAVFVGSGLSEQGIPFSYHADWGSTGRWSVELHTPAASYRLCPLEKLFRRDRPLGEWEEVPVPAAFPQVKIGFVEQVAGMLAPNRLEGLVPRVSLEQAARLGRFGEEVFGYRD